ARGAGLVHLRAGDVAVMVGVEPLEHPVGALAGALLAQLAGVLRGEAAVMVDVQPGEALVGSLDDLLSGDVGVAVRARRRLGLGERRAGAGDERDAGDKGKLVHVRSFAMGVRRRPFWRRAVPQLCRGRAEFVTVCRTSPWPRCEMLHCGEAMPCCGE